MHSGKQDIIKHLKNITNTLSTSVLSVNFCFRLTVVSGAKYSLSAKLILKVKER